MNYDEMSQYQKQTLLEKLYVKDKQSFQDIAISYNTYANKIRRDAKKFGIHIRTKSEAQKNALQSGKHKHPTKGTNRDESTKSKIGRSVMTFWDQLDDKALKQRKLTAKANWDNMSDEHKANMQKEANNAVRASSKTGSKLEKFFLTKLIADGYKVDFHKEQLLSNTKLQIDLFLPKLNIAIEVDGPSHFLPVWGQDTLNRNITYDNKKTGLILGKGMVLIRVKQLKEFSKARAESLYEQLIEQIKNIEVKFPPVNNRNIEIGDR